MAGQFKVTIFNSVRQDKLGGYGISFWNTLNDGNTVVTMARALGSAYNEVTGGQTVVNYVRIADLQNFRAVQVIEGLTSEGPLLGNGTDSDYITSGLLLRLANGRYTVNLWMRALWDAVIDKGGRYVPVPLWREKFLAFTAILKLASNGWAMRCVSKDTPIINVTAFDGATGIVTAPGHTYANGQQVRISRMKGFPTANKVWRITNVSIPSGTFTLVGWAPVTGLYGGHGTSTLQVYTFLGIQSAEVIRATSHRAGRPFGLLGGRRKRRVT